MILLFWVLNFGISLLNAWGCGKSWSETKSAGGVVHFLNWCGAIMGAAGFTWCYLVIFGFVGANYQVTNEEGVTGPLLDAEALEAFISLGYSVIILPIIGSGLAITVNSWRVFMERRTLGNGLATGWNTYAQVSNTISAIEHAPNVGRIISKFFEGDSKLKGMVLFLVVFAVLGGALTTYTIITMVAASEARQRSWKRYLAESESDV